MPGANRPAPGALAPEEVPTSDRADDNDGRTPVAANYAWWREHGGGWAEEYDRRKRRQVLYHIQELMLSTYFAQAAPAKVLEFGCGVGRHLRNLAAIPGLDVFGFDQSRAMAEQVRLWAEPSWVDAHVSVGEPTARLPYDDRAFDIVYTAEVLVHVRPEDLDGVLRELVRVCRGHVLHFETSAQFALYEDAHDGCWKHDLAAAYARLGLDCEALPWGYAAHTPHRTYVGDEAPRFEWPPIVISLYRRLEQNMNAGFEALEAESQRHANEAAQKGAESRAAQEQVQQLRGEVERLQARSSELERLIADLEARVREGEVRTAQVSEDLAQAQARVSTLLAERLRFLERVGHVIRR